MSLLQSCCACDSSVWNFNAAILTRPWAHQPVMQLSIADESAKRQFTCFTAQLSVVSPAVAWNFVDLRRILRGHRT